MVGCAVTTMTTAMKKLNGTKGSVKKGDLLVLVDDGACRDGAEAARRLRRACSNTKAKVVVLFVRIPDDFILSEYEVDENVDFKMRVKERMKKWTLLDIYDMTNLRRLGDRVQGGWGEANLKSYRAVLKIDDGTEKYMMCAVEQRLRDLNFDQYDAFMPGPDITDIVHGSPEYWKAVTVRDLADQGCPGHFEYINYSRKQVCVILGAFALHKGI